MITCKIHYSFLSILSTAARFRTWVKLRATFSVLSRTFCRFVYTMMRGDRTQADVKRQSVLDHRPALMSGEKPISLEGLHTPEISQLDEQERTGTTIEAFGMDITKEQGEGGQTS